MNLVNMGVRQVTLVNRNVKKAQKIANRFDVDVAPFSALVNKMADADLVIFATGSTEAILKTEHITAVRESGSHQPIVLMDLSVPRNIEPAVGEMQSIRLINMDMLNDRLDETYKEREANIPLVENIIDDEFKEFKQWINEQRVVPTIKALTRKLDDIRQAEMEKYSSRFGDHEIRHADQLTRRIVNKILAYSIDHLKEQNTESDEVTRVVQNMFKIEPDQLTRGK